MNKINLPGNKKNINERQNYIEKTMTFKQLVNDYQLFCKLSFQVDIDEDKVAEMVSSYNNNPDYFMFKNKIIIAVVFDSYNNYKLYVVDGQHRIEMAINLYNDYDVNDNLIICYYKIYTDKQMKELFKEINRDSFKNNNYISLSEFQETIYDMVKEYFNKNYSIYFSAKKSVVNKRYSLTDFLNLLVSHHYIDKWKNVEDLIKDLENTNKKFNHLIDYQEYYSQSTDFFYKDEHNCVKNAFVMSLKNNNFIDYLINKETPDHNFKHSKKTISPKLRILVWEKEFNNDDQAICPFYNCNNIIRNGLNGFHCGHIISEANGGETTLNNLKPICSNCNCRMGKINWKDYEKKCKLENKINKSLTKLQC
jgi:hypothetical protein